MEHYTGSVDDVSQRSRGLIELRCGESFFCLLQQAGTGLILVRLSEFVPLYGQDLATQFLGNLAGQ
jgi:hypothetical protein